MTTPIPDNRARFSLAEIVAATRGEPFDLAPETGITGISTDSRSLVAGNLFVALRGGAHDAHRFVDAVRARGALALVARDAGLSGARVEVADTLIALGEIARAFVERSFAGDGVRPVLAIGGAAGKTTTKTLAAAAVGALFGETLVTAGNLNNRIGVPMTLLTLEPSHRAIVLECGTSERGEIAALGAIARPDVALVTNVGIEHSAGLGNLEEIADEESDLLRAARRVAISCAEEPLLMERLAQVAAPVRLRFGLAADCDVRLAARTLDPHGHSRLEFALARTLAATPASVTISTALLGPAAALNIAAALAGALALLDRPATAAELDTVAAALGAVEPVPGRLFPRLVGQLLVLDDSYNSNSKSVPAALAAARELAGRRGARLIVALGDMLELGDLAAREHDEMVAAATASGAALVLFVGPESGWALERTTPPASCRAFADSTAAAEAIGELVRDGDLILIKGSRGMRMERLLTALETGAPV